MSRDKKYPGSIYSGIHPDDENSWGMCCSYEMACRCAEDNYDYNRKETRKFWIKVIPIVLVLIVLFIFLASYEIKLEDEPAVLTCEYCHRSIEGDQFSVHFQNYNYHTDCFGDALQNLKVIPVGGSNYDS